MIGMCYHDQLKTVHILNTSRFHMTSPCQIIQHNPRGFSSKGKCFFFPPGTYGYMTTWSVPYWNYKQWAGVVAQGWPTQWREELLVLFDHLKGGTGCEVSYKGWLWSKSRGNQIYHVGVGVGLMFCDRAQMLMVGIQAMVALALEDRSLRRDPVCNQGNTHIPVPLSSLLSTRINEKEGRRNNL